MNRAPHHHHHHHHRRLASLLAVSVVALTAAPPLAVAAEAQGKTDSGPSAADFARLEREVAEQRQLVIQMLQIEQDRYNMLLKLLQAGGQLPPGAVLPSVPSLPSAGHSGPPAAEAEKPAAKESTPLAVVTGHVQARSGTLKDAYVYLDQVRGSTGHGRRLEIKQKDKQFSPQVAVVLRGTNVVFPNLDPFYHNVFSTSGRNSFDLGGVRAGETPGSVVLNTPGVVEVFCNFHARMNASILVVPSSVYTKVAADGSFRLENVPVGSRKIVAWSPNASLAQERVEVTAAGGQASFTLDYAGPTNHPNKLGQPYGSYKD